MMPVGSFVVGLMMIVCWICWLCRDGSDGYGDTRDL
jgi:hypothetical protein